MTPAHWGLRLWPGRRRRARDLLRFTAVRGGHAATVRRLLRIGPWSVLAVRYRPGDDQAVNLGTHRRLTRRPERKASMTDSHRPAETVPAAPAVTTLTTTLTRPRSAHSNPLDGPTGHPRGNPTPTGDTR